jgi:hypothetical protein
MADVLAAERPIGPGLPLLRRRSRSIKSCVVFALDGFTGAARVSFRSCGGRAVSQWDLEQGCSRAR